VGGRFIDLDEILSFVLKTTAGVLFDCLDEDVGWLVGCHLDWCWFKDVDTK